MGRNQEKELRSLLKRVFSVEELKAFILDIDDAEDLFGGLPWDSLSPQKAATEVTSALLRHGLADVAFFDELKRKRPRLMADVEDVALLFRARGTGTSPSRPAAASSPPVSAPEPTPPSSPEPDGPPPFMVKLEPKGASLVGREQALEQLHEALVSAHTTDIGRAVSLTGAGGMGKTQLAVEYAHRYRERYPGGVFWITADHELEPQLQAISDAARWVVPNADPTYKISETRRRLPQEEDALVIIDNVEAFERVKALFPSGTRPRLLLTSLKRLPVPPLALKLMLSPEDARLLLSLESGRARLAEEESEAASRVVALLGGWPLAIELAGAYLKYNPDMSIVDYAALLEGQGLDAEVWADPSLEGASNTRHKANLRATLRADTEILASHPLLAEILDVLAWSGPAAMGRSLLAAVLDREEIALAPALALGAQLQILRNEGEHRYRVHRLMQQVLREDARTAPEALRGRATRLAGWFKDPREEYQNLSIFEAEFDHLEAWQRLAAEREWGWEATALLWLQAYPAHHWGKFADAVGVLRRVLALYGDRGCENPVLEVNIRNVLAACLSERLERDEAWQHWLRASALLDLLPVSAVTERVWVLANLSSSSKDANESFQFGSRAHELATALASDHPARLSAERTFAAAKVFVGEYEEALSLAERLLEKLSGIYPREHPAVFVALQAYAYALRGVGMYDRSIEVFREVQHIRTAVHPDDRIGLSHVVQQIAESYRQFGQSSFKKRHDRTKAIHYHEQASEHAMESLHLRRMELGPDSQGVVEATHFAATCLWQLGMVKGDSAVRLKAIELLDKGIRECRAHSHAYARLSELRDQYASKKIPGFRIPPRPSPRK